MFLQILLVLCILGMQEVLCMEMYLANILSQCGYFVTKEYYINDVGLQIETLIDSVILRYKEALNW